MNATLAGIAFDCEPDLSVAEFRAVLVASTLAARRPVDDAERLARMLAAADLVITARDEGRLVGISRAITDFTYACYLSDLAVDEAYQGRGMGRALIDETRRRSGAETTLFLVAAPAAESYYPHIGMQHVSSCWKLPPDPAGK